MRPPVYVFQFEDAQSARGFVRRLVKHLNHLAIYIEDTQVMVMDGDWDRDQWPEITRLARKSSASMLAIK